MTTCRPDDCTSGKQAGYALLVVLAVLFLLLTVGFALQLAAAAERISARGASARGQALDRAEALASAASQALLLDLERDRNGWANRYLVACEREDAAFCRERRGFDPDSARCRTAAPPASCILVDRDGALTGRPGQWVVDLAWRPGGRATAPAPLERLELDPGLRDVLPWWRVLDPAPDRPTSTLAVTPVASRGSSASTPRVAPDVVEIDATGTSDLVVHGRLTGSAGPARAGIRLLVRPERLRAWEHALASGGGVAAGRPVVDGSFLVRGSLLVLGRDAASTRVVLSPASAVLNHVHGPGSFPPIDGWWLRDARPCGDGCAADDPASIEAVSPRLPQGAGGEGAAAADSRRAVVRVRDGSVLLGGDAARLGEPESTEPGSPPGAHASNLDGVELDGDPGPESRARNVWRREGAWFDRRTRSRPSPILDAAALPSLAAPYTEPRTGITYSSYTSFLRAGASGPPGVWALDLTLDGEVGTQVGAAELAGGACWPRRGEPSTARLIEAFSGATHPGCAATYTLDPAATTCGDLDGPCATASPRCEVVLRCGSGPECSSSACPPVIRARLFRRAAHSVAGRKELALDTSSSLGAPRGRGLHTRHLSFADRLYRDLVRALDPPWDPRRAAIYRNNLAALPEAFRAPRPPGSALAGVAEESAYLDVHVQLPDAPGPGVLYPVAGRWLSVRFRAPGNPRGEMTVLCDARARSSSCTGLSTDLQDEVIELEAPALEQHALVLPALTALDVPAGYERAQPLDPEDRLFRNSPTGAFVVALHLPCGTSSASPIACSAEDAPPLAVPGYRGFYTHLLAYAPKYTTWRRPASAPEDPVGHPAPATSEPCGDADVAWFAESLAHASATTLAAFPRAPGPGAAGGLLLPVPDVTSGVATGSGLDRAAAPFRCSSTRSVGACADPADGSCSETFTPLVTDRIPELDPSSPDHPQGTPLDCDGDPCSPVGDGCAPTGIDPDALGPPGAPDRHRRAWPGWASIGVVEAAGVLLTREVVRLGAPTDSEGGCYNCESESGAGRGLRSDPIVYDGRAILCALGASAEEPVRIHLHDHLVPRGRFGDDDFLALLSSGATEVGSGIAPLALKVAVFSLSETELRVTPGPGIRVELAGSWLAREAHLGEHSPPVQVIGTREVAIAEHDHPFLPGREPWARPMASSWVETVP